MALIEMVLELSNTIERPPMPPSQMYSSCTSSDEITVRSWEDKWLDYQLENAKSHDFSANSVLSLLGDQEYKPVIVAGSGPSLKKNALDLKARTIKAPDGTDIELTGRGGLKIVSCLHNFNYMEDNDIMTENDLYITLDSGEIVIKEVYEGGKHPPEWYWERTKDRTLCAYTGTHPGLISKWRGKILWFAMPPQSEKIMKGLEGVVDFKKVPPFSVGGCVAGAAMYLSRVILNCGVVIYIGMDFAFDYAHKFHSWDSQYDAKFQGVSPKVDIFGNRVWTWPSYYGFKLWFDFVACGGLGGNGQLWINCTEGGLLGAYPDGNIKQIIQMDLKTALHIFNIKARVPKALESNQLLF